MGNCWRRSLSMGGRWALYCGSICMRTAGRPLSNAQITPSGSNASTILRNMLRNPKTALVGRPSGAFMVGGTAWNARCISELPSMTATTRRLDEDSPDEETSVIRPSLVSFAVHQSTRAAALAPYPKAPSPTLPQARRGRPARSLRGEGEVALADASPRAGKEACREALAATGGQNGRLLRNRAVANGGYCRAGWSKLELLRSQVVANDSYCGKRWTKLELVRRFGRKW